MPGFQLTIFGGSDYDGLMFKKLEIMVRIQEIDGNIHVRVQVDKDDLPENLTSDQKSCLASLFEYLFKLMFFNIVTPRNGLKLTKNAGSRDVA